MRWFDDEPGLDPFGVAVIIVFAVILFLTFGPGPAIWDALT